MKCFKKTISLLLSTFIVMIFTLSINAAAPVTSNITSVNHLLVEPLSVEDYGKYDGNLLEVWGQSGDVIPISLKVTNTSEKETLLSIKPLDKSSSSDSFSSITNIPTSSWKLSAGESKIISASIQISSQQESSVEGYFAFYQYQQNEAEIPENTEEPQIKTEDNTPDNGVENIEEDNKNYIDSANDKSEATLPNEELLPKDSEENSESSNNEEENAKTPVDAEELEEADEHSETDAELKSAEPTSSLFIGNRLAATFPKRFTNSFSFKALAFSTQLSLTNQDAPAELMKVEVNSITPMGLLTLTLDSVPSFSFGNGNTIQNNAASYNATSVSSQITVGDGRIVSLGWRLTAKMGGFSNPTYSNVLTSATLNLPAPNLTFSGVIVQSPFVYGTQMTAGEASAHTILSASPGVSLGTWTGKYTASSVSLGVPHGTAYAGTSTSNILWTLYDAP